MRVCQTQKIKNISTLSSFEAIKVFFWFHHWMYHWCVCGGTIWFPFLVFSLSLGPTTRTQCIRGDGNAVYPVNPLQIHATLSKQVFTPWLVTGEFFTTQIIQRRFATVNISQVSGYCTVAEDLERPEEAEFFFLAILEVNAIGCHFNFAQIFPESHGQEHGISIDFHSPIFARPHVFFLDLFPHLDEHVSIDPMTVELPFRIKKIIFNIIDLYSLNLPRTQPCGSVTEHPIRLTSKNTSAKEQLGPQQVQIRSFFRTARFMLVKGKAKEVCC